MKFREITNRLTGFSIPVFGISWNPPEAEATIVRRIIAFMEDRRVLYVPSEVEVPDHCVQSVLRIREFLTNELASIKPDSDLGQSLMALRSSCRKFLNAVQADEGKIIRFGANQGHYASWVFISAIGEMRGVFGVHLAKLAVAHGLDVEDDLAEIFPAENEDSYTNDINNCEMG